MDKPTVLAFMITRADTDHRRGLLKDTVEEMLETAKYPFDLLLFVNTDDKDTIRMVTQLGEDNANVEPLFFVPAGNRGQHIPTNNAIEIADGNSYDYLLRVDDDVKFMTKGWLAKMIESAEVLGPEFIISPMVRGLLHPPPQTDTVEVEGIKVRFLEQAIGGICRLHSVDTLCDPEHPYHADIRLPMGFGDATGIGVWCKEAMQDKNLRRWMIYLEHVRVRHRLGTAGQRKEDPLYHTYQGMFQCIPYIPPWCRGVSSEA
jgi:hypothetical protein